MAWHNWSTGSVIGRPFQGEVIWHPEYTYGSGTTITTTNKKNDSDVGQLVEVARMETGDVNKYFRGIDSIFISKGTKTNINPAFHLEYVVQADDILLDYLVDRSSSGTVRSLAFKVGANLLGSAFSWYTVKGAKCGTVEINGSEGEPWKVSADFSVSQIDTSAADLHSAVTAGGTVNGDACMFNVGGTIYDSTDKVFAYVTKSFSVTVNHNLQDLWTVGQRGKAMSIESALDVTGTMDISLDDGGKTHFDDVLNRANETTVVLSTSGTTGAPVITLTNVKFDSSSIDVSPGNEGMMESVPFTAEQISVSTK